MSFLSLNIGRCKKRKKKEKKENKPGEIGRNSSKAEAELHGHFTEELEMQMIAMRKVLKRKKVKRAATTNH